MAVDNLLVARAPVGFSNNTKKLIPLLSSAPSPQNSGYPPGLDPITGMGVGGGTKTIKWQDAVSSGLVTVFELPNVEAVKELAKREVSEQFMKLLKDLATEETIRSIEEQVVARTVDRFNELQERINTLEAELRKFIESNPPQS